MDGDPIRLGIVGGGLITQVAHLPALGRLDALFQVEALADPSRTIRDALAARHRIPRVSADHGPLLEQGGLDALLVCSPNGTHAEVVLDALDAGLHVLVEKPLCITARDAAAIIERARRAGRVVQVGYMKRFDPAYEAFAERLPLADDLRLVTTTTVDPMIGRSLRPDDFVAPGPFDGRGHARTAVQVAEALGSDDPRHVRPFCDAFLGALVHDVNLVLGLLDRMGVEIGAVTDAISGYDGSLAYGALDLGARARWTAAWMLLPEAGPFREDVRVFAADGIRGLTLSAPYQAPAIAAYERELEHFHACVRQGVPCRTPAEQGARDVALLTDVYRAAVAG